MTPAAGTSLGALAGLAGLAGLAMLAGLAGCGDGGAAAASGDTGGNRNEPSGGSNATLTVFAAASLTDAFTELDRRFEDRTGATVRTNFAGSSTLATQIVRGAPADVYASANPEQMRRVANEGLVASGPRTFAANQEVILVPDENPAGIGSLRDLGDPGVRLVLAAEEVPAAQYAERILTDAESRYGDGFRRQVLANVVSRESDVRAAVNRVVLGDADATFAYSSDLTPDIRDRVEVVEIPPNLNVVAEYPAAVLDQANNKELARQWITFLRSDTGQRVLEQWGFQPAPDELDEPDEPDGGGADRTG